MTSRRERCLLVYEATVLALPLLLIAKWFYASVHFVRISPRAAKWFGAAIKRSGARQYTEKEHLNRATVYAGRTRLLTMGRKISERYPWLGRALAKVGGSENFADLANLAWVDAYYDQAYIAPFLERFFEDKASSYDRVDFFTWRPIEGFLFRSLPSNVRMLTWARVFSGIVEWPRRATFVIFLFFFPLFNCVFLLRKGARIAARPSAPFSSRGVLLVHREHRLLDPARTFYRDMYFLNAGILRHEDCVHINSATGFDFTSEKKAYLESRGGQVARFADLRISWGDTVGFAARYWRRFVPILISLCFCPAVNGRFFKCLLILLHYMSISRGLLSWLTAPLIVFEPETALISRVLAIEARRKNRHSISMIHGIGAQHNVTTSRFELQFDDIVTYGGWDDALREASPRIKQLVPCGNIEIDVLDRTGACLPAFVRRDRSEYKVVGFLARLDHVLATDASDITGTVYLDEAETIYWNRHYFAPLFRWLANRPDVVMLWQAPLRGFARGVTPEGVIDWLPWCADLAAMVPTDRLLYRGDFPLEKIVAVCDVCIGNDASSAIACAMSAGVPSLSIDLLFGGQYRRYHTRMVAETPEELIENLDWLLVNGLPDESFSAFNRDMYGSSTVDFRSSSRIAAYFRKLLAEQGRAQS